MKLAAFISKVINVVLKENVASLSFFFVLYVYRIYKRYPPSFCRKSTLKILLYYSLVYNLGLTLK